MIFTLTTHDLLSVKLYVCGLKKSTDTMDRKMTELFQMITHMVVSILSCFTNFVKHYALSLHFQRTFRLC